MRQFIFPLIFFVLSTPVLAWNAAGHRLTAYIAWQQLSPATQDTISRILSRHPDYTRWAERAHSENGIAIFAEASTWPDDIRSDPRFYDDERDTPTQPLPGLPDTARHKPWHYVDLNRAGKTEAGELDSQIERLSQVLRSTGKKAEISNSLPWLAHLVADIHQPLHVGRHGDEGGNKVEIENPLNHRLPITNLHTFWDDLPGPPWLRGKRLEKQAVYLMKNYPAPTQGSVALWRSESHRLLDHAYPDTNGSLLPAITEAFQLRARDIANRRIVEAGYRLGHLLENLLSHRVSRETP